MPCRLCGSARTAPLRAGGLDYARCLRCGYVALLAASFPTRKEEEARYRLHRNDPGEPGFRAYLERFIEIAVEPFLAPGASVLDFGSGPVPALSLLLEERGYRARAYDPFFAPREAWRRRSWAGIAVHEVAEHLRSPRRSLAALARRLEPGGTLALRTRFLPAEPGAFDSWWYRMDPTHLGFFAAETPPLLAADLGLDLLLLREPDIAVFGRPGATCAHSARGGDRASIAHGARNVGAPGAAQ